MLHIDPKTAPLAELIDEFRRLAAIAAAEGVRSADLTAYGAGRVAEANGWCNVISSWLSHRGRGDVLRRLNDERVAGAKLVRAMTANFEPERRAQRATQYAAVIARVDECRDAARAWEEATEAAELAAAQAAGEV